MSADGALRKKLRSIVRRTERVLQGYPPINGASREEREKEEEERASYGVSHLESARDYALDALGSADPQRLVDALSVCQGFERNAMLLQQSRVKANEELLLRQSGGEKSGGKRRLRAREEWRPKVQRYHELRTQGQTLTQARDQVCKQFWGNSKWPDPKTVRRWLKG